MSVKDLIKKSVLELDMFKNSFTPEKILQMVIALGVALLMGLVICFIYNRFFRGVVYNRSFAVTLVGMTVLTCMVTLAISTNVVLSLGMVGALSIVPCLGRKSIGSCGETTRFFWGGKSRCAASSMSS